MSGRTQGEYIGAAAEDGGDGAVHYVGSVGMTAAALDKLLARLSGDGVALQFCYKAGPCGYGVYRHLTAIGPDCVIVAPPPIPPPPRQTTCKRRSHRQRESSIVAIVADQLGAVGLLYSGRRHRPDAIRKRDLLFGRQPRRVR